MVDKKVWIVTSKLNRKIDVTINLSNFFYNDI